MLSVAEIKNFIEEDMTSDRKTKAGEGQRYYEAEHDILKARLFYYNAEGNLEEDKIRSNIKISHPFFKILIDELSPYMLSFEDHPIRAKETATGLQEHLDEYFGDEFWSEIGDLIDGTGIKGFEYLYGFKNEEGRMTFECADAMGVVEVQAKYAKDGQDHKLFHYLDVEQSEKGKRMVRKIQDWTINETYFWVQDNESMKITKDKSVKDNPRPHVKYEDGTVGESLGVIPFWRLDNNKKQFSSLKPVKAIIDDYDLHACSLSNNLVDFDTPIHVVKGYDGSDLNEVFQNLKTKKTMAVDADGGVEVKTIDVPYEARKEKLSIDKENIYVFGMGFDPTQVGDGNITNIVIKSRYTLLHLRAEKLEKRLKKFLRPIVNLVIDEINAEHGTGFQHSDVIIEKFQKNTPTNDSENIANAKIEAETKQLEVNTILNVAANVGDEQTLKAICEIMEWDFEELQGELEKMNEPQNLLDAKGSLNAVIPE